MANFCSAAAAWARLNFEVRRYGMLSMSRMVLMVHGIVETVPLADRLPGFFEEAPRARVYVSRATVGAG